MTMIAKLNLSKTCSRFCKLINKEKRTARFLKYAREITHCQFTGFLSFRKFANSFKFKFYEKFVDKSDQFYIDYVLDMICDITAEKILAHMFWCTRNRFYANCDLCVKFPRFYNELPDNFVNKAFYNELWNKTVEKVFDERFCYQGIVLRQLCVCDNIENLSSAASFMNFYGVLAIRIFFNIIKKYMFTVKLRNKELFFNYFSEQSKIIFESLCNDREVDYVTNLIKKLKPCVDYNPSFTKIPNEHYIKYLECT